MTTNKNDPHHPRPQGKDLTNKIFKVEDATGKVFGTSLTWDEAWKLKEKVAGERKSTTPRIRKIDDAPQAGAKTTSPQWSEAQRMQAAQRAAHLAANSDAVRTAEAITSQEHPLLGGPTEPALAELLADIHPDAANGAADGLGDGDIDALIDEAEAASVLEH